MAVSRIANLSLEKAGFSPKNFRGYIVICSLFTDAFFRNLDCISSKERVIGE
jgi:hypothetical protein